VAGWNRGELYCKPKSKMACSEGNNNKKKTTKKKKKKKEKEEFERKETMYIKSCNKAYNYGSVLGIKFITQKRILSKPISRISGTKLYAMLATYKKRTNLFIS